MNFSLIFCQCMLNSRVSDCRNVVPTIRRGVYTEYTPTACMTYNTVCSQARTDTECALVAQGHDGRIVSSLCAKKNPSSGQPCHPLAGPFHISSLPVHHSTQHFLDSATFSKKTQYTKNNYLKSPYQKLQQTQSCRKTTRKNHSHS